MLNDGGPLLGSCCTLQLPLVLPANTVVCFTTTVDGHAAHMLAYVGRPWSSFMYDMIRFDYAFRGGCKRMYVSTSPHFQLCEPVPIARALCDVATERLCGVVLIPSTTVHINEISCCTAEQCCWWC